jgi:hypothetical protein
MKAILLFANEDDALGSRMQVGLDLARAFATADPIITG